MEVVGFASSVISLLQLTGKVTTLCYAYIHDVKWVSVSVDELVRELSSFTQALVALRNFMESSPQSPALQLLVGTFRDCTLDLEGLLSKLESKNRRWGKLYKLQWPIKEAETAQFIARLTRSKSILMLALTTDQLSLSQVIEYSTNTALSTQSKVTVSAELSSLTTESEAVSFWRQDEEKRTAREKRKTVLNWLYLEPFDTRHIEISNRRIKDTGMWVFRSPEFQKWSTDPEVSLLWGYGIPGAGKTFISSAVIDHFMEQASYKNYGVAYVYFSFEEEMQSPAHILGSLLKQLACQVQNLPIEIEQLYDKLEPQGKRPSAEELYTSLLTISTTFDRLFLVFDALDEYNPRTERRNLLRMIHMMANEGIKFFLTSRPYLEDIRASLHDAIKIELAATPEDITTYIREKINENPRAKHLIDRGMLDYIIPRIVNSAGGMFLLAHFHIIHICQQTTARQILAALEKIGSFSTEESPLDPIYDRFIESVWQQSRAATELALAILSWVVRARRPLSAVEIQTAVSIEINRYELDMLDTPDRSTLVDVCAGLVMIDEDSNTILLAHHTVLEYLLRGSKIPSDTESKIAIACCTYLSFDVFAGGACDSHESLENRREAHPFLDYAVENLAFHLKACDEALTTDPFLKFLNSPGNISSYLQVKYVLEHNRDELTYGQYPKLHESLHVASAIGHAAVVVHLLDGGSDIEARIDDGRTALCLASSGGHEPVVRLLLEKGANLSVPDNDGWTALHWATFNGHEQIVQLLLEKGADILAQAEDRKTTLCLAASEGHEQVVRLLLDKGAEISVQDKTGWTALHWAVFRGHEAVVDKLIGNGVDLESLDNHRRTPLWMAASEGHKSVVRMLLKYGADISAQDSNGRTVLHQAAFKGHQEVTDELTTNGANLESFDNNGRTPLRLADLEGHESVVRMLLDKGANNSVLDNNVRAAPHQTRSEEYKAVVQTLPQHDVQTQTLGADQDGHTLEQATESEGQNLVAQVPAQKTANLPTSNQQSPQLNERVTLPPLEKTDPAPANKRPPAPGVKLEDYKVGDQTPRIDEAILPSALDKYTLFSAISKGHEAVIQQMLAKGVDISTTDENGRTLLYQAANEGQEQVVRLLLQEKADPLTPAKDQSTALCVAAGNGYEDIVQLLLEKGADLNVMDKDGWTPLYRAVCNGHEGVARLLHQKATISSATGGQSAFLCLAVSQEAAVGEKGPNFSRPDGYERTPLYRAAFKGQETIFGVLFEMGVDISDHTKNGRTMLCVAASRGHEAVVRYLLDKKADPSIPDNDGWTPLHWATFKGHEAVFMLLIEKGADISVATKDGRTVLALAASEGHNGMVQKLLQQGADVSVLDKYQRTPLYLAASAGHETVVQLLLEKEANPAVPDQFGRVPLYRAAYEGHETVVQLLLARGAHPTIQDNRGQTPLHQAVSRGHITMTQLLLKNSANVAVVGKDGIPILALAATQGHEEIARLLLEHGANHSVRDNFGRTPLYRAASEGYEAVARLLLDKGADASAADKFGRTPLFQAASEGHEAVVRILLERGADASASTKDGRTALRRARSEGYEVVIQLLETALNITASGGQVEAVEP